MPMVMPMSMRMVVTMVMMAMVVAMVVMVMMVAIRADTADVMVMSGLRRAVVLLEADELLAVLAHLAVHVARAR